MKSILTVVMVLIASTVFAGPFGLDMGMTLAQVTAQCVSEPEQVKPGIYKIVPKMTNNNFSMYVVFVSKTHGLGAIRAISDEC